jgi:hypothetical protein
LINFLIFNDHGNNFYSKKINTLIPDKKSEFYKKKNLIIGAISNYSWETVAMFFKSIVKSEIHNYDCVIFVRMISEIVLYFFKLIKYKKVKRIKEYGVIIYEIPDKYKYDSIINIRWKLYFDYLNERKDEYNLILATDIRDTIFQKDIFQLYENNKPFLGVFLEDILLKEKVNKDWVLDLCNETEFNNYFDKKPVICGGTLIGTIDKFIEFCQEFMKIALETKANDQGILNYII